jgi:hypothetical protein
MRLSYIADAFAGRKTRGIMHMRFGMAIERNHGA